MTRWLLSLGRRPLKRRLPNQREVRMLKHLRWQEGMTGEGADRYLRRKKRTGGDVHSPQRAQALVDKIESEVRGILRLLR